MRTAAVRSRQISLWRERRFVSRERRRAGRDEAELVRQLGRGRREEFEEAARVLFRRHYAALVDGLRRSFPRLDAGAVEVGLQGRDLRIVPFRVLEEPDDGIGRDLLRSIPAGAGPGRDCGRSRRGADASHRNIGVADPLRRVSFGNADSDTRSTRADSSHPGVAGGRRRRRGAPTARLHDRRDRGGNWVVRLEPFGLA